MGEETIALKQNDNSEVNMLLLEIPLAHSKANIITKALTLETKNPNLKSAINLNPTSRGLEVKVKSPDLSSLRAAINTFIRWIDLGLNLMDVNS